MVERVKGRDGIGEAKRVRGRKKRGGSSTAVAKGVNSAMNCKERERERERELRF